MCEESPDRATPAGRTHRGVCGGTERQEHLDRQGGPNQIGSQAAICIVWPSDRSGERGSVSAGLLPRLSAARTDAPGTFIRQFTSPSGNRKLTHLLIIRL